jgi:hypothetical protein
MTRIFHRIACHGAQQAAADCRQHAASATAYRTACHAAQRTARGNARACRLIRLYGDGTH